ncbi:Imm53 family immunity protein [Lentzea sp. NPDC051213]|uniref:Imm53 family immunity protein n=1 Tax=Lentzea sp. NPDC051213 TaxID=3364126 RepID=UPI00379EE539
MPVAESPLQFFQRWYAEQCNGDWEHEFGVKITTLDNPGWHVVVDLGDTDLEGRTLDRSKAEPGEGRWIWASSDGQRYESSCDLRSLDDALSGFREFALGQAN